MEEFDFYPQKPELIESKINRKTSLTFFSMLLFALGLVLIGSTDFLFIFFVILVLFVHEIGHFSFMKIYQYKNVRMLFVPLMGAFVQGKKDFYQEKQSFFCHYGWSDSRGSPRYDFTLFRGGSQL